MTDSADSQRRLDPDRLADHVDRLYAAAYALSGSHHDAEDLVQETFERVLRRPRFLRNEHDVVYLHRVLRNAWNSRVVTAAHRRSAPAAPEDVELAAGAGDDLEAELEAGLAFGAMRELSEPLRQTIVAVDVVGLSYKQAARALGIRTGTVMSRLYRARERLAELMGVTA